MVGGGDETDPKKVKLQKRKARDLRMLIAEKQLSESAKTLKKSSGGSSAPGQVGIDEDLGSKAGAKIQSLRQGLHTSREKARRQARVFTRGR